VRWDTFLEVNSDGIDLTGKCFVECNIVHRIATGQREFINFVGTSEDIPNS
jgi:hypothetical protein